MLQADLTNTVSDILTTTNNMYPMFHFNYSKQYRYFEKRFVPSEKVIFFSCGESYNNSQDLKLTVQEVTISTAMHAIHAVTKFSSDYMQTLLNDTFDGKNFSMFCTYRDVVLWRCRLFITNYDDVFLPMYYRLSQHKRGLCSEFSVVEFLRTFIKSYKEDITFILYLYILDASRQDKFCLIEMLFPFFFFKYNVITHHRFDDNPLYIVSKTIFDILSIWQRPIDRTKRLVILPEYILDCSQDLYTYIYIKSMLFDKQYLLDTIGKLGPLEDGKISLKDIEFDAIPHFICSLVLPLQFIRRQRNSRELYSRLLDLPHNPIAIEDQKRTHCLQMFFMSLNSHDKLLMTEL